MRTSTFDPLANAVQNTTMRHTPLLAAGLSICCAVASPAAFAQDAERAERHTTVVSQLRPIDAERWTYLSENPDNLSVAELNRLIPEANEIEVDNSIADASPGESLRVVCWNIERGRHWREAVQLIESHEALRDPDIVLLSEMDNGMARSGNEHTTREMALALGMNYAYGVEYVELSGGDAAERVTASGPSDYGYHGNAILSRFPLRNVRLLRFPGIERWYGSDQHRLGGRIAVIAEIEANETAITLISTHYESDLADHASRERESRMILAELREYAPSGPAIFGGDLNTIHTRPAVTMLIDAGFDFAACNLLDEPTVQRVLNGEVRRVGPHIDYIAARDLAVVRSESSPAVVLGAWPPTPDGRLIGDHAPVSVVLKTP